MLTLYFSPNACSRACHIALEEAGAAYTATRVNFQANQQRSPDYLKLNPKGRVPALATERGILTETPAILAYIAQSFPAARLAALDDPFEFAKAQAFNGYLSSTVHVAHAHGRRGARWADEASSHADMQRKVPANMLECFGLIETGLLKGPWVMGEAYSICDPYLFTLTGWLDADKVDLGRLPRVKAHFERMKARPAVAKVVAREDAVA